MEKILQFVAFPTHLLPSIKFYSQSFTYYLLQVYYTNIKIKLENIDVKSGYSENVNHYKRNDLAEAQFK